jgi:hypothetical protein
MMKYIATLLASIFLLAQVSFAKSYSYIYIEGDKQTPFYVKLEGQMLPRLGKNYCIIPNLDAGITNIEILFQQNKYPTQKFVVKVPAEGSRGFVLQKVNDQQFALYDMQQGIYLVSGNTAEDDQVPAPGQIAETPVNNTPQTAQNAAIDQSEELPAFAAEKNTKKKKAVKPVQEETPKETVKENDRFITDIELNADGSRKISGAEPIPEFGGEKPVTKKKSNKKSKKENTEEGSLAAINDEIIEETGNVKSADQGLPNSDCKSPMSSEDFENFALKILDKTDDDARLKALNKNKGKLCFTTEQVRIIANNLDTQSGRYEVTRILYSQTSDQDNYSRLESLFKTNYLKGKFREIINPK